jgi:HEAT repeat protein
MRISFKTDQSTILKIIEGSNTRKKLKVFNKIKNLSDTEQIKIYLKILEDHSWSVREKAAHELVKFGKRVVPRLKKISSSGLWFSRAAASIALGEIANLRALDSIIYLILNDKNPTVIKEASGALCKIARKHPLEFIDQLDENIESKTDKEKILRTIKVADSQLYNEFKEDGRII